MGNLCYLYKEETFRMKLEQLKSELHQFIENSEDGELLEKLKLAFQKNDNKKDWWHEMTAAEQEDIKQGLYEIEDEENLIDHSKVMEEAKKWEKR